MDIACRSAVSDVSASDIMNIWGQQNTCTISLSGNQTIAPFKFFSHVMQSYLLTYLLHGAESFLRS